jgi:uncharacterized delta-60 repeat protein
MMKHFTRVIITLVVLFSCIASSAQTFQWTWLSGDSVAQRPGVYGTKGVPSVNNKPGARNRAVSWKDANGNLWLFGGLGFPAPTVISGALNDLWKYNPTTHEWTWVSGDSTSAQPGVYGTKGVPSPNNKPGARQSAISWTDNSGNLWLMGGSGNAAGNSTGYLNDLWKYDIANNTWTWVSGDNTANSFGVYGTKGVSSPSNKPGGRWSSVALTGNNGELWLFGGYGFSIPDNTMGALPIALLNDLWKYNTVTNEWTWVSGDSLRFPGGVYGSKGVPSPGNKPGGRFAHVGWTDANGNFWFFGGSGLLWGVSNSWGDLNDLWRYDVASNQWTWMAGDTALYRPSSYGILGVPSPTNMPGARLGSAAWRDISGNNLWLFGGIGNSTGGDLNDLWKYNIATNLWTWEAGSQTGNVPGIYGQRGVASPINQPGGREGSAVTWTDADGNLLLFGGFGRANIQSYLNDLWQFTLATGLPLSTEFGSAGKVTTDAGGSFDEVQAIKVMDDGKVVAAGTGYGINSAVARYQSSGALDPQFGNNGQAVISIAGAASRGYDAVVQPDGKILVAGVAYNNNGVNPDFLVIRLNADGSPDAGFGNNGKVITDFFGREDQAQALVLQPDGKIVVAGWAFNGNTFDFALARYLSNGNPDPTFDGDGKVTTNFSGNKSRAYALAIQADGKLVAGGNTSASLSDFALVRYNTDGSLDASFNGGKVIMDIDGKDDGITAIAIQNDGKIVAAGYESNANPAVGNIAIARFTITGTPDINFSTDGKLTTDLGGVADKATDLAIQPDGNILVSASGGNGDFMVIRYLSAGNIDPTFGNSGIYSKDFDGRPDFANSLQLRSGNIYLGGRTFNTTGDNFALALVAAAAPLPVKLVQFTASKTPSGSVVLNWETASLEAATRFEIQRSTDGRNFEKIGTIEDNNTGKRNFSFTDAQLQSSTYYYRLKIDDAASFFYSAMVIVRNNLLTKGIDIFPNPVKDILQLQTSLSGELTVSVLDAEGRIVKTQRIVSANGITVLPVNVSTLTNGNYMIRVSNREGSMLKHFVKTR